MEFYTKQQGTKRKVLFEHTRHGEMMHGFTENYIKVCAPYNPELINNVTEIEVGIYNDEEMAMNAVFL